MVRRQKGAKEDLFRRVRSGLRLDDFRGVDRGQLRQTLPELPGQGRHLLERPGPLLVEGLHDLSGPVTLLSEVGDKGLDLG
jgi:hypothetical protein